MCNFCVKEPISRVKIISHNCGMQELLLCRECCKELFDKYKYLVEFIFDSITPYTLPLKDIKAVEISDLQQFLDWLQSNSILNKLQIFKFEKDVKKTDRTSKFVSFKQCIKELKCWVGVNKI